MGNTSTVTLDVTNFEPANGLAMKGNAVQRIPAAWRGAITFYPNFNEKDEDPKGVMVYFGGGRGYIRESDDIPFDIRADWSQFRGAAGKGISREKKKETITDKMINFMTDPHKTRDPQSYLDDIMSEFPEKDAESGYTIAQRIGNLIFGGMI